MIARLAIVTTFTVSVLLVTGCVRNTRGVRIVHLESGEVQRIDVVGRPVWTLPSVTRFDLRAAEVDVQKPDSRKLVNQNGVASDHVSIRTGESFTVLAPRTDERWKLLDVSAREAVFEVRGHFRGAFWMGIPGETFQWTVLVRSAEDPTAIRPQGRKG